MANNTFVEPNIRFIPVSYNPAESQTTALRIILSLFPQWEHTDGKIEFIRFTDGITNTLMKVINKRPGLTDEEIDNDAVLLRAYGKGTDVIIDRKRETQNHELLMQYNLAPKLLARFPNGMLYRFIRGRVTAPADLRKEQIWRGVARRLAQWHAIVPCLPEVREPIEVEKLGSEDLEMLGAPTPSRKDPAVQNAIDNIAPGKLTPNCWSVMQKWIYALPTATEVERERQAVLQKELLKLVDEMSQRPGLGDNSLVFAHCDLLSGNIIVQPRATDADPAVESVNFIDYEYATPAPAAFDIANHFAEWGGFDCDMTVLPTRHQRREFIGEYITSYFAQRETTLSSTDKQTQIQELFDEVDLFRGVPSFYWGIWALIQASISQIDFDYASYAQLRLSEYWAWRAEADGSRVAKGEEMGTREKRWAQEI